MERQLAAWFFVALILFALVAAPSNNGLAHEVARTTRVCYTTRALQVSLLTEADETTEAVSGLTTANRAGTAGDVARMERQLAAWFFVGLAVRVAHLNN